MTLPPPAPRRLAHTRQSTFHGYQRDDGLWDIEAEMVDTKPFEFALADGSGLPPGQALHRMLIRLTIDHQLVVRDIATRMGNFPHGSCHEADQHMRKMIGSTMAKGWRKSIDAHLGGVQGCTHMRELLYNMATAAYQTLAPMALAHFHGLPPDANRPPPPHLGGCMTWDFNGQAVAQLYPVYFQWPARMANAASSAAHGAQPQGNAPAQPPDAADLDVS
ncbi:DUF2889 domain-containing protein [Vandammella animalimorsus]|uniref:DUF2889 domain-containing protein n=1 Tax=Vandammella animalimorsus TaxID=2029117 RepID=A0A2A2AIR8_9BURK|nr:DUF2889 domain-containing protein [Vandammella animalimorsus]PAT38470.1 hypothetical protein CK625_03005 [Vandammella animalimorsus]